MASNPILDLDGPEGAAALVFVHGAGLNRRMWLPFVERFKPAWRVAALDLPGHGSRASEPFRLEAGVEAVRAAIGAAGPGPAVLIGDSLGGYLSIATAAAHPDRVAALVLGGCTVNFTGLVPLRSRASGWIPGLVMALMGKERFLARAIPRLGQRFPEAPIRAIADAGIEFAARDAAIGELSGIDFKRKLAAVKKPLTLVNGEADRLARRSEGEFHRVSGATLVVFPGVGHGVSLLRPTRFGDVIQAQLDRLPAR